MSEKKINVCYWECQYIIGNTLCNYDNKKTIIPPVGKQCPYDKNQRMIKANQSEQKKSAGLEKKIKVQNETICQSNPWMDVF